MNRKQEDLIATGLWLLIKHSDKIRSSEKEVWMIDYDELFGEEDIKEEPCCEMPERDKSEFVTKVAEQLNLNKKWKSVHKK